jgi:hypothetical protein
VLAERIDEKHFKRLYEIIFETECLFPIGNPVRAKLFEARICVAAAKNLNREEKDYIQHRVVYSKEKKEENNFPSHHTECRANRCEGGLSCLPYKE